LLDAPVGYLASLARILIASTRRKRARRERADLLPRISRALPDTEQLHFIGKDIYLLSHAVLPAMAEVNAASLQMPDHVYAHGFITVVREKMSKSRGGPASAVAYLEMDESRSGLRYYISES